MNYSASPPLGWAMCIEYGNKGHMAVSVKFTKYLLPIHWLHGIKAWVRDYIHSFLMCNRPRPLFSNKSTSYCYIGIPIINPSDDRLRFMMEIPIPVRPCLIVEGRPRHILTLAKPPLELTMTMTMNMFLLPCNAYMKDATMYAQAVILALIIWHIIHQNCTLQTGLAAARGLCAPISLCLSIFLSIIQGNCQMVLGKWRNAVKKKQTNRK